MSYTDMIMSVVITSHEHIVKRKEKYVPAHAEVSFLVFKMIKMSSPSMER